MPSVLLTGGTGFIGSHTCVELMAAGWTPILFDNLCNSSKTVLDRIEAIAGRRPAFVEADLRDRAAVDRALRDLPVEAVIHFAGLKSVGESMADPLRYYENNVAGTLVLLDAMRRHGVNRIVFSSSATVYGMAETMPLTEDAPTGPINAYGRSKLMVEQILADIVASDPAQRAMLLRYFNPVGAHASGLIGEDPGGIPNNLMPFVAQVAVGRRSRLRIFGGDYPTDDGTGVRDYIHVVDLAQGTRGGADEARRSRRAAGRWSSTSAPDAVTPCSRWCEASRLRAGRRYPMTSSPAGQETWPFAMPMSAARASGSVGKRSAASTRCARTRGDGRRRIRTVSDVLHSRRRRGGSCGVLAPRR